MMKNSIFAILILLFVTGCSTNDDKPMRDSDILGTWNRSHEVLAEDVENDLEEGVYLYSHKITFSLDNSFTEYFYLANKEDLKIIGYLSKNVGTYTIEGNRLHFSYDMWYSSEEYSSLFVPLEELILRDEDQVESPNYSFSGNRTKLMFDFDPCGETQNCLDKIEFEKE